MESAARGIEKNISVSWSLFKLLGRSELGKYQNLTTDSDKEVLQLGAILSEGDIYLALDSALLVSGVNACRCM